MLRTLILFCCALLFTAIASAQTKRAFIVGVQNYDELTDLTKTLADADGYADVFGNQLGFTVTKLSDPSFTDFLIALSDFEASIEEGDEIVFVFSGHGWSDGARNFVAMRDAPLRTTEVVLERLTFDLNEAVINKFRARDPSLVLAIVDACRDNPFDLGTKTITKGLVPQQTIPGTLVVYAAGASQRALDRLDPDDPSPYSVFTRTLLPKLENAQTPLMRAFDEARAETAQLANTISHAQRPAIYSDVSLDFCFAAECETTSGDQIPDPKTQRDNFLSAYHAQLSKLIYQDEFSLPFVKEDITIIVQQDIDGDGYDDFYARVEHLDFCGSGGCMHQITTYSDGTYPQIFSNSGGSLNILQTRQNGLLDLALGTGFTLEREPIYDLVRFNGEAYQKEAVVVCELLVTYCDFEDALTGNEGGNSASRMVFLPIESDVDTSLTLEQLGLDMYEGLDVAYRRESSKQFNDIIDYIAGVDDSDQYVLVHVWKGTYGIARPRQVLQAAPMRQEE